MAVWFCVFFCIISRHCITWLTWIVVERYIFYAVTVCLVLHRLRISGEEHLLSPDSAGKGPFIMFACVHEWVCMWCIASMYVVCMSVCLFVCICVTVCVISDTRLSFASEIWLSLSNIVDSYIITLWCYANAVYAMALSLSFCLFVCPSICVSVTSQSSVKMAKFTITQTVLHGILGTHAKGLLEIAVGHFQ